MSSRITVSYDPQDWPAQRWHVWVPPVLGHPSHVYEGWTPENDTASRADAPILGVFGFTDWPTWAEAFRFAIEVADDLRRGTYRHALNPPTH